MLAGEMKQGNWKWLFMLNQDRTIMKSHIDIERNDWDNLKEELRNLWRN